MYLWLSHMLWLSLQSAPKRRSSQRPLWVRVMRMCPHH
jgi:hypothetical protein